MIQRWQTDNTLRGYNLTYDGLSRLTQAAYRENGSSSSKYTTQYTYDSMGNPLTLKRRGKLDDGSFGLVDDLTYTYDGNRLLTITDANEDEPTYQGAFHFTDGAEEDEEYAYDNNGNLITDLNKGIVNIGYNLLNLPQLITFQDSSKISYLYDADGNKQRVTYTGGALSPVPNSVHTIDYCGNYIYEDGTLSRILIDGGYITFTNNQPVYHFYIQDHLGNIRVVADQNGVAEQVNHYYPYGGIIADISTNQDIQRHKYNGKEYDRMYGLNLYDYGARHYDPATLAWTTMDPLAEKYYPNTPYGYCGDNPMNAIDNDGRKIIPVLFKSSDSQGNAVGKQYYSNKKVINAMTVFGKTTYGNKLISSFIPKGKSQYGVSGNGKYSDFVFKINQFDFSDPTDQFVYMGNNYGKFSVKEEEGVLNIIMSLDVASQNVGELVETITHELTVHGYLINEIISTYQEGGIEAVNNMLDKTSEESEHHDIISQSEEKGGKLYYDVKKELIKRNVNLEKVFNERLKFYENYYK